MSTQDTTIVEETKDDTKDLSANTTGQTANEFLGMSDEDFLNAALPGAAVVAETPQKTPEELAAEEAARTAASAATEAATTEAAGETKEEDKTKDGTVKQQDGGKVDDPADTSKPASTAAVGDTTKTGGADPAGSPAKTAADTKPDEAGKDKPATQEAGKDEVVKSSDLKPEELQGFYNSLIGVPIKANGKTIVLKNPDEVLRLVQMGAGYGRKIQDLQPHLKVIRMLEKNELLDEGKLSYAIDLINKNPDAIKKLIKESNIDPLDLNIGDNVSYIPNNHSVSDKEMAFTNAVADVRISEGGVETLKEIDQKWDRESKNFLFDKPDILGVIQAQRENGIYDQIVAEIDRQKLLGNIPNSKPFIHAYHAVGEAMMKANAFKLPEVKVPQVQTQSGITPQPQVIATTTAAPKAQVTNSEKVAAAAPSKAADSRKPGSTVNPLNMPDDEFLKQFNGRL